jgi:hypothetical protein
MLRVGIATIGQRLLALPGKLLEARVRRLAGEMWGKTGQKQQREHWYSHPAIKPRDRPGAHGPVSFAATPASEQELHGYLIDSSGS